jgi:hypothetical protein
MRRNLTPHVCPNSAAQIVMLAVCCNGWIFIALAAQTKPPDAPRDGQTKAPLLVVRLYNYAGVPAGILARANEETVRIFREAGIELSWAPCAVSDRDFEDSPSKFDACRQASDAPIMRIEAQLDAHPVPWRKRSDAGAALEDQVRVSYERAKQLSADAHISQATLLGHVMAHEIGHVLLGENSHSSDGIMINVFREQELRRAERGKLLFTERQPARMRARIRGVALRAESVGGPNK